MGSRKRKKRSADAKRSVQIIEAPFLDEVTPNRYDDLAALARAQRGVLTTKVRAWRVAKSLMRLLEQVNQLAPQRSTKSDGTIGDPRHQTRNSDHNPWVVDGTVGVVTARDITHDPKNGCDAQQIADSIVASRDPRVKYIIWNRQICNSTVQPWKWRKYSGTNPHTKHIHISVLPTKTKYDDPDDWRLIQAELSRMVLASTAAAAAVAAATPAKLAKAARNIELAWGKKVSEPFKGRVIEIAAELGVDPNHLMSAMAFETMRTFRADIQNPKSKATGLIQFMPSTARGLGTSIAALKRMTPVAQLEYVRRYFAPYKGRLKDLSDVYMAILWPRAVGKLASFVLFAKGSSQYRLNPLDANNDGVVTKAEAASRVQQHLVEGLRDGLRG